MSDNFNNNNFGKDNDEDRFENADRTTSKWEPDGEKYNTERAATKKKKSKWWIPVVIVTAALVAVLVVGGIFAVNTLINHKGESIRSGLIDSEEETVSADDDDDDSGLITGSNSGSTKISSGVTLTDVSDIVSEAMPSVVSITSRTLVNNGSYGNFWGFYYGNSGSNSSSEVESGVGSGTIVGKNEKELLILTSYHVVEDSSSLYVTFHDDSAVDGYIKAVSEQDDIAIVAIKLEDISDDTLDSIVIATLSKEQPNVGEGAIVIGDALGYGQSVVTGIISALDREITVEGKTITVIQTDAAINSGNSGGCLLNSKGEIVGISEAKINSSSVEGMCYAISVNHYYDTIMDMLNQSPSDENSSSNQDSSNDSTQSGYLGIYGYDVDSRVAASYNVPEGVYVVNTIAGGGAAAANLQEGDIIIAIDGEDVASMSQLQTKLTQYKAGDTVTLTIMRYENSQYTQISVDVTLTEAIG